MNRNDKSVPLASIDEINDDEDDNNGDGKSIVKKIVNNDELHQKNNSDNHVSGGRNDLENRLLDLTSPPPSWTFLSSFGFCENLPLSLANPVISESQNSEESIDTGFFSFSTSKSSSIDAVVDQSSHLHSVMSDQFSTKSLQSTEESTTLQTYDDQNGGEEYDDILLFSDEKSSVHRSNENFFDDLGDDHSLAISTSLEDLVSSFDDKIKSCLKNFDENVAKLAPVHFRSKDEIIQNRPAWWTLTGNYGNILPIDWEKLSVKDPDMRMLTEDSYNDDTSLKLETSTPPSSMECPVKFADEVLREIDDIISGHQISTDARSTHSSSSCSENCSTIVSDGDVTMVPVIRLRSSFYRFSLDKLKSYTLDQLQDFHEDLEAKTQKHSEELVSKLAQRDELEFEKEVKNSFLSLFLKLHKKRKEVFKQQQNRKKIRDNNKNDFHYLTTVIPFQPNQTSQNIIALQSLIKILRAILDDSPAVPRLLTDYILRFVCPSNHLHHHINHQTSKFATLDHADQNLIVLRQKSSTQNSSMTNRLSNTLQAARRSLLFKNPLSSFSSLSPNHHHHQNSSSDDFTFNNNNNGNHHDVTLATSPSGNNNTIHVSLLDSNAVFA